MFKQSNIGKRERERNSSEEKGNRGPTWELRDRQRKEMKKEVTETATAVKYTQNRQKRKARETETETEKRRHWRIVLAEEAAGRSRESPSLSSLLFISFFHFILSVFFSRNWASLCSPCFPKNGNIVLAMKRMNVNVCSQVIRSGSSFSFLHAFFVRDIISLSSFTSICFSQSKDPLSLLQHIS